MLKFLLVYCKLNLIMTAPKKLISYLFYFIFFFIPLVLWPQTSEIFEFNKIITAYFVTILIACLWVIDAIIKRKFLFRRTILDIPIIIFLLSQFISTIISIDQRTSFLGYYSRFNGGLASSLSYSLLYWAYVSNVDNKGTKNSITALFISTLVVSTYGILEHFGIDKNIWVQDVQNRVFSTLGQPNWLAAWLVAILPLTWAVSIFNGSASSPSRAKSRDFQFSIFKKLRGANLKLHNSTFWVLLSGLLFITLLYTKSRSGLLGFLAADITFWVSTAVIFLKSKTNAKSFVSKLLINNIILLVLMLIAGSPWTPNLKQLLTKDSSTTYGLQPTASPALELGGSSSVEIRRIVWRGAIATWKHYPIFGSGAETFAFSYYKFRPVAHNLVSEWDFLYNKAHNEYLNFAATSGSVGLLSYLILIIVSLITFMRIILRNLESVEISLLTLALLAGYVSILVTNFFGFSVVPVSLLFYLFPALAVTLEPDSVRAEENKLTKISHVQKIGALLLCSFTLMLFYSVAKYWYADLLYSKGKLNNDRGNYKVANDQLQKAIKLSPKEATYWAELADIRVGIVDAAYESGDKDLGNGLVNELYFFSQRAINLSPYNVNLRRSEARIFINLSPYNANYLGIAKKDLEDALVLAPTDAKLYYNLALTYLRIGDIEKSKEILHKTIDLKSNYRDARYALALLLIDEGNIKEAKNELNYILTNINPDDTLAREALEEAH